jgi:hypothetical protein
MAAKTHKPLASLSQAMLIAFGSGKILALRKLGVEINDHQVKMLRGMLQSRDVNKQMQAQVKLLELLEMNYKGAGKIAAETGMGPIKKLGVVLEEKSVALGRNLLQFLNPYIKKITESLRTIDPIWKKVILYGLIFAATLGPLTMGISLVIKTIVIWKEAIMGIVFAKRVLMSLGFIKWLATEASWLFIHIRTLGILKGVIWSINAAVAANPVIAGLVFAAGLITTIALMADGLRKTLSILPHWLQRIYEWLGKVLNKMGSIGMAGKLGLLIRLATAVSPGDKASETNKKMSGIAGTPLHSSNKSEVHITVHAPKGTVKEVAAKTTGTGLKLGYSTVGN